MILSHRYGFIFIKPTKVAGTSIEINLAKHCGEEDIITPITIFSASRDEDFYEHPARNYEGGFYNHMSPAEIIEKVGCETWNDYFKFTVARNPWDYLVSRLWWERAKVSEKRVNLPTVKRPLKESLFDPRAYRKAMRILSWNVTREEPFADFSEFLESLDPWFINDRFYFDQEGKPLADFYLRYENLENDYEEVCGKLEIPYSPLVKTKSKTRKDRRHYSAFYDDRSRRIVEERCAREIAYFAYRFEEAP